MSVFPLSEGVLLYVRAVIHRGRRRWRMLAAWQTEENGPCPVVSRAFVCLCLTRRLLVHRSCSFNTSSHGTKRPLSAGSLPSSQEDPAAQGHWCGLGGGSIKCAGDTLVVDKHQHNSMQHWSPWKWEKTESVMTKRRRSLEWWVAANWINEMFSLCITNTEASVQRTIKVEPHQ